MKGMGRMSDIDIEIREQLEHEYDGLLIDSIVNNEYEREEYIRLNYKRVEAEVYKRAVNAARMVR